MKEKIKWEVGDEVSWWREVGYNDFGTVDRLTHGKIVSLFSKPGGYAPIKMAQVDTGKKIYSVRQNKLMRSVKEK